jgi:hypothetical protein
VGPRERRHGAARASELAAEIEAGVKALGLEVRAGLFEELGR